MYLKRLELQGFKTFAQKTAMEFMPDRAGRRGITAIVGPNGSGKSNAADGIRWVMGEQSMKLLRGKKSEDVIFSGTAKRARSGFAEVTMILENDDLPAGRAGKPELNMSEIAITRRLYRDGQSEYEVNRQAARLQDVALLLAQCGVGQRTYSVIGQGMVDAVLVASPGERKEFFDEAFGLKTFQLKRHSALQKIDLANENLRQSEALLREIEPRLATLERQVKRLMERDSVEKELRELERAYYGAGWQEIAEGMKTAGDRVHAARADQGARECEAKKLEEELARLEKAVPPSAGFRELRQALDKLAAERAVLREREFKLEAKKAVEAVRAEKPWAPLPLSKIIASIEELHGGYEEIDELLHVKNPDLEKIRTRFKKLLTTHSSLLTSLQRPAPEPSAEPAKDEKLERELAEITQALADVAARAGEAEARLEAWNKEEEGKRSNIFELQHKSNRKRQEAQEAERKASEASIELARWETRRDGFLADLRQRAPALEQELDALVKEAHAAKTELRTGAPARLQRLRSQLEWIGGIDPETVKEHGETKTRFDFLTKQSADLRESLRGLETVVAELDATIKERSDRAFRELDREFGQYFKKLFSGGEAKLVEVHPEPELDEEGNVIEEVDPEMVSGIDIQATPPGKRNKGIALLSGGERALTSIALICAIMATNPSPFVVLDEVDAALDESNSRKFAEIIDSLAHKTQFIVVTHNRATMQQANVLYGVTMGDDGVSQLISVKIDDVEKMREKGK